ncbi:MAG: division/cell wall cluster transcriptional repressor MraZ [Candidatus Paceibacterota bacterium]
MFIGEYNHNLDEKGRLAIPVKFREELKGGAVVTKGLDGCLFLYPISEWKILADKLSRLPINQANTRAFARLMLAGAMDVSLDKQGRVIVPDYLRKYINLSKKVIINGLYNRLEIWSEDTWEEYKKKTEADSGEIAEQLGEIGI